MYSLNLHRGQGYKWIEIFGVKDRKIKELHKKYSDFMFDPLVEELLCLDIIMGGDRNSAR